MKILLTGKNGQLGFELQRALSPLGEVIALGHRECDLADPAQLRSVIAAVAPGIIVNAAAFTAVDQAESEPALAEAVNGLAPGILGEEAAKRDALVVHYSTDYVFDGRKAGAYSEADTPNPLNVYGRSKLAGERALIARHAKHLILRTSWVFGAHGGNFAKTMLRLAMERDSLRVVADQTGAPTSAALIADVTAQILGQYLHPCRPARAEFAYGLYHLAASGRTTWYEYARTVLEIAQAAGCPLRVAPEAIEPIPAADYPTRAARPANSCLDTTKLKRAFGLHLPDWRQGLEHMMSQLWERL